MLKKKQRSEIIITSNYLHKPFLKELWNFRSLFYFLSRRDLVVAYKQTVLGIIWNFISPIFMTFFGTIVFSYIAKLPSDNIPYPILVLSGTLIWNLFESSYFDSVNSLFNNQNLISSVYFPRLITLLQPIVVRIVNFSISFCMLIVLIIFYEHSLGWEFLFFPIFVILTIFIAMAFGIYLAPLIMKYHDFKSLTKFIMHIGHYASPVAFSSSVIPEELQFWYSLNPLTSLINGFRWSLTGVKNQFSWVHMGISVFIMILIFYFGLLFFRKKERTIVDVK